MFPIIFQYKFITISLYGVMLAIGFFLSFLLLEREFKLRNINPEFAYKILVVAIIGGLVGSRLFDILDHLDQLISNPKGMIFTTSGAAAYGGYILAFIFAIFVIRYYKENIIKIFDAASPALALGYSIGRFGCHASGDGCFGIQTTSIWGTVYPNGLVPANLPVYPTPLFESLFSFIAFGILLNMRKKDLKPGILFSTWLILSGVPRFLVEFIRRNPRIIFELTQAQVVGLIFTLCGILGLFYFNNRKERIAIA